MAGNNRKAIRAAAKTALTGLATTGGNVFASRIYPLAESDLPCLVIYTKHERTEYVEESSGAREQDRYLDLIVEIRAEETASVDDVLDDSANEVEAAIVASNKLGGLVSDIQLQSTENTLDSKGDKAFGLAVLTFQALYFTEE